MTENTRWFECTDCGYELPESELCCGDYDDDGSIQYGSCKACCSAAMNHAGRIYDGKSVAGGTFERCE